MLPNKRLLIACLLPTCLLPALVVADELCADRDAFAQSGWQHEAVQDAMDNYMRDHRMRANWGSAPMGPDTVGRDYYEWLWMSDYGAKMKIEVMNRFCGPAKPAE
ncbi:MAG TPA: hypothetical protein VM553_22485 [Dongiaceae bacterium]|nr:hypothetical protein [Dongiaceae bacterium]